ncbi:MAG: hypothetical protein OSB38_12060 [Paraburkholderia fungorum]|nr:hypothetical protein [Paraburkholderia fungorum]
MLRQSFALEWCLPIIAITTRYAGSEMNCRFNLSHATCVAPALVKKVA